MRRRVIAAKKEPLKAVKELDAFPKVPDSYQETTVAGGGVSIVTFLVITILVISEIRYYSNSTLKYDYEVDKEFEKKIKINVDLTVAMTCDLLGADVVDLTGANAESFGSLKEEPAYFELSPLQRQYQQTIQHVNNYIRQEYAAMHEILWKTGYGGMSGMPARETTPESDEEPDACRIHGSLVVNKVAGNFHITAGKVIPNMPGGTHMHTMRVYNGQERINYNFSHRIDHLSFGEVTPGVVNPLDGDIKISDENYHMFQYFVEVVPTKVETTQANVETYQFAATERNRSIDHNKGSHGVPGIFLKYDVSSFKVHVKETHQPYSQFLVRLCGIIGGVFATSGMIHSLIGCLIDVVCCRYKFGKYKSPSDAPQSPSEPITTLPSETPPTTPVNLVPDAPIFPTTS
ncbi:endoplasmic reticulum-Golgi intermediate compartment protein 2-like isoform X2 [Lineus longissimus]|uniref:endoplasmic reticulum-Golgi intermediate compartment protein 2-like isoform X2 n=1 Tax=Lineus longissimus TaxID=88925 RepID=UPI002B4E1715